MKIVWNERSAGWFRSASEYTGYNKALARLLLEHIPCRDTLCDVGCGAGLVAMELARHIREVTCVDLEPEAIAAVKRNCRHFGVENVRGLCMDARDLEGQWDTVTALFFGGQDFMREYYPLARESLILVTHGKKRGNLGPEEHKVIKSSSAARTKAYLDGLDVHYHMEERSLEHGQPLGSLEEARTFVKAYSTPMSEQRLEEYLAEKLVETGRDDFPLYLPNRKEFGLFVIHRAENRHLEGKL